MNDTTTMAAMGEVAGRTAAGAMTDAQLLAEIESGLEGSTQWARGQSEDRAEREWFRMGYGNGFRAVAIDRCGARSVDRAMNG